MIKLFDKNKSLSIFYSKNNNLVFQFYNKSNNYKNIAIIVDRFKITCMKFYLNELLKSLLRKYKETILHLSNNPFNYTINTVNNTYLIISIYNNVIIFKHIDNNNNELFNFTYKENIIDLLINLVEIFNLTYMLEYLNKVNSNNNKTNNKNNNNFINNIELPDV